MAATAQAQLCRSLEPFSEGETFNQHDAPRNNKQAHEPAGQLMADLGVSLQSHSASVEVYSLPDFEIAQEDNPGNKPFDGHQNNHDLATLRNLVAHGAYNPFEFGERRGYGPQKEPVVMFEAQGGSKYSINGPEDCILQELLNVRMAPPLPPHQSMQMVVEECAHPDPSRVGGHSHYASKPFDNLSDSYMLRKESERPARNHFLPNSGTISFMIESLPTEHDEDVQIPDNCELLSDRMKFLERSSLKPHSSMLSSRPSTTTSSLNTSFSQLDSKRDTIWSPHVNQYSAASPLPYNCPPNQLASAEPCQRTSLYSMIQSQVISLKTNKFRGVAAISK